MPQGPRLNLFGMSFIILTFSLIFNAYSAASGMRCRRERIAWSLILTTPLICLLIVIKSDNQQNAGRCKSSYS